VPTGAKVRSYPILEKWNIVWIWMGDPAKAEPGKIPDMPWLSDPKWASLRRKNDRHGFRMDGAHFSIGVRGEKPEELMLAFDRIGFCATPPVP
jgi:phenylpropionate dioxygenase-like ring-hydroxylating dioxygenase large terminal subunit